MKRLSGIIATKNNANLELLATAAEGWSTRSIACVGALRALNLWGGYITVVAFVEVVLESTSFKCQRRKRHNDAAVDSLA